MNIIKYFLIKFIGIKKMPFKKKFKITAQRDIISALVALDLFD